jgi:hypothetical protein
MKRELSPVFEKYPNIKFYEKPSSEVELFHKDRQRTDRHDEASSRLSQFANAPKKWL